MKERFAKLSAMVSTAMVPLTYHLNAFAEGTLVFENVKVNPDVNFKSTAGKTVGMMLTLMQFAGVGIVIYGGYNLVMGLTDDNNPNGVSKGLKLMLAGLLAASLKLVLQELGVIQ